MLHNQYLAKFLWGEATNTMVYIQDRIPHMSLDNRAPEEVFIGNKPS